MSGNPMRSLLRGFLYFPDPGGRGRGVFRIVVRLVGEVKPFAVTQGCEPCREPQDKPLTQVERPERDLRCPLNGLPQRFGHRYTHRLPPSLRKRDEILREAVAFYRKIAHRSKSERALVLGIYAKD